MSRDLMLTTEDENEVIRRRLYAAAERRAGGVETISHEVEGHFYSSRVDDILRALSIEPKPPQRWVVSLGSPSVAWEYLPHETYKWRRVDGALKGVYQHPHHGELTADDYINIGELMLKAHASL